MTDKQIKEQEKRRYKYQYPIELLIKGLPVKDVVFLTNTNTSLKVTIRTVQRLKKEFIDLEDRY